MASLLIRSRSACGMAVLLALLTGASTIIHYELAVDGSLNRRDIALVGVASGVTPVEWTAEGLRLTVLSSDSFRS